jgi:hypothetical protein
VLVAQSTRTTASRSSRGTRRLDVVAVGVSGALQHLTFDGAWHSWEDLGRADAAGTPFGMDLAATAWAPGRFAVFGLSGWRGRWIQRYFDGDWHGATLPAGGGILLGDVAATSWAPRRIDLFGVDTTVHGLVHWWFDSVTRWNGPDSLDFTSG